MTPRRILVISEGQLGDLLLLTPALRGMKASFPQCRLTLLVVQRREYGGTETYSEVLRDAPPTGTGAMLGRLPFVDEVIEVSRAALRRSKGLARIKWELAIIRRIRRGSFDTAIACFPEDRFALWTWLSGANRRVGQRRQGLYLLFTSSPSIEKEMGVLRYYASLAKAIGAEVRDERTEVAVSEEARRDARRALVSAGIREGERYAVIHPGASGKHRVWPPERFAEVISGLKEMTPLLCGTPFDREGVEEVARHLPKDQKRLQLSDSVEATAALLQGAALVLSNDSGPRHLAVALGVPSVAIMPKHNEKAWGVYEGNPRAVALTARGECPGCPPDRCLDQVPEGELYGSRCIRMVTVEEVRAAIGRAMGKG